MDALIARPRSVTKQDGSIISMRLPFADLLKRNLTLPASQVESRHALNISRSSREEHRWTRRAISFLCGSLFSSSVSLCVIVNLLSGRGAAAEESSFNKF